MTPLATQPQLVQNLISGPQLAVLLTSKLIGTGLSFQVAELGSQSGAVHFRGGSLTLEVVSSTGVSWAQHCQEMATVKWVKSGSFFFFFISSLVLVAQGPSWFRGWEIHLGAVAMERSNTWRGKVKDFLEEVTLELRKQGYVTSSNPLLLK